MRAKSICRDFFVCFSLANLIMMKVWLLRLPFDAGKSFWGVNSFSLANSFLAPMICTILIGLGLLCLALVARRWQTAAVVLWPFMYGTTLCFLLNGVRTYFNWGRHSFGTGVMLLAAITAILFVTGIVVRYRHIISRQHYRVPLVFAPFILVTFGQCAFALRQLEPESAFAPPPYQNIKTSNIACTMPVVWIIFDELDYGISFGRRPKGLLLPELDSLLQTSISATHAFSPFDFTHASLPALLTGKSLRNVKTYNANKMVLTEKNGRTCSLQTASTIFTDMHNRGSKTALFGWAFPYSRLFSTVYFAKDYLDLSPANSMNSELLAKAVVLHLITLVESDYLFATSLSSKNHILIARSMQNDVTNYLQTNKNGFTFLHYPVPHAPYIYNRYIHRYGTNRNVKEGYLGNVALVDLFLGEIRTTMQKAGTWDEALIVISADHHWRFNKYDYIIDKKHVPFLVKLPHQTQGISVDSRFETVRTREMIVQIVDGKLKTPEDVQRWMSQ